MPTFFLNALVAGRFCALKKGIVAFSVSTGRSLAHQSRKVGNTVVDVFEIPKYLYLGLYGKTKTHNNLILVGLEVCKLPKGGEMKLRFQASLIRSAIGSKKKAHVRS